MVVAEHDGRVWTTGKPLGAVPNLPKVRDEYAAPERITGCRKGAMSKDPREYRLYALQCAELAAGARTPQLKATLLELSANWVKLAGDLEAAQAVLAHGMDDRMIACSHSMRPWTSRHDPALVGA